MIRVAEGKLVVLNSLDWLIHVPWWVAALIIAAAGYFFWLANKRQDRTLTRISAIILLIGILLGILGLIFPTDLQKMERRSRDLIAAIDARDWNKAALLLDTDSTVGTSRSAIATGRDLIIAAAKEEMSHFQVSSVRILSLNGSQTDSLITITLEITSTQAATQDMPQTSSWQLDYQQEGDHWLLEKITLIAVGQENMDEVENLLGQ